MRKSDCDSSGNDFGGHDGKRILEGSQGAGGHDHGVWRECAGSRSHSGPRRLDDDPLERPLEEHRQCRGEARVPHDAKPGIGNRRSPLKTFEQWLLDLVADEPDLTLKEIRARLVAEKKLKSGTTSIWRFYERHKITFKKNSARRRAGSP